MSTIRNSRTLRNRVARARYNVRQIGDLVSCHWCRRLAPWDHLTNEHVVRRSNGGRNTVQNVVLAHAECNQAREIHLRSCGLCARGGPCLVALIYGDLSCRSRPRCLLNASSTKTVRMAKWTRFSLAGAIRSGRREIWSLFDWRDPNYYRVGQRATISLDVIGFVPKARRETLTTGETHMLSLEPCLRGSSPQPSGALG